MLNNDKKVLPKDEDNVTLDIDYRDFDQENSELARSILAKARHVYGFAYLAIVEGILLFFVKAGGVLFQHLASWRAVSYGESDIVYAVAMGCSVVIELFDVMIILMLIMFALCSSSILWRMIMTQTVAFYAIMHCLVDLFDTQTIQPVWFTLVFLLMGCYLVARARFTEKNLRRYSSYMATRELYKKFYR